MTIKKRVELSSYCWIISALSTALMCGVFVYALKRPDNGLVVWILGAAIVVLFLFTLCYMPLSISVDKESLNINRPLKIKSIPLPEITDVRMCARLWAQSESVAAADGSDGMAGSRRKTSESISPITARPQTASSSRLKTERNICSAARMLLKWSKL